jgi:hypothetical protein
MFGGTYEAVVPVTADHTVLPTEDLIVVPASVTAVKTITLPLARSKDAVYVNNLSSYPQAIAVQSGDTLRSRGILLPGELAKFSSDNFSTWYRFSPPGVVQVAEIALTAVLINAIRTTPVALVPAPGAGRVVIVESIVMQMVRTATQFASGGAVEFRYTNGSGAKVSADISATLVTGAAGTAYASVAGVTTELTPVANAAVVITCASADFTTGTGTGKVRVAYRIEDFN